MNYYNDNDKHSAGWLRELIAAAHIPNGVVDERSISDVQSADLKGYNQCHFFAGIGGWPFALKLAGWDEYQPVWTGSCPCQPISCAGLRKGHADQRHLWPAFYRLISECKPATVFGEQVAGVDGREWLAGVRADLEGIGYAVGAANMPASGVGALHQRKRLFWVASNPSSLRLERINPNQQATWNMEELERLVQAEIRISVPTGKHRALANGVPGRMVRLRGYGNAIVPQVAAKFIEASTRAINETSQTKIPNRHTSPNRR